MLCVAESDAPSVLPLIRGAQPTRSSPCPARSASRVCLKSDTLMIYVEPSLDGAARDSRADMFSLENAFSNSSLQPRLAKVGDMLLFVFIVGDDCLCPMIETKLRI